MNHGKRNGNGSMKSVMGPKYAKKGTQVYDQAMQLPDTYLKTTSGRSVQAEILKATAKGDMGAHEKSSGGN